MRTLILSLILAASLPAQAIFLNANYVANLGTVATPTYDNDTGTYSGSTSVTISDATSGAAMTYCTATGSDCNPVGGTSYSTPVTVSVNTTHLCSYATKASYTDSATKCATYTITVAYTDDFAGSGSLGANWSVLGTQWTHAFQRVSGVAQATTTYSKTSAIYTGGTFSADQSSQVTITTSLSSGSEGVCVRLTSTGNGYCMYSDNIQRMDAGTLTQIHYCGSHISGDVLKISIVGSSITVNKNGSLFCSVTDGTYASGGYPGIIMTPSSNLALGQMDNWIGQ